MTGVNDPAQQLFTGSEGLDVSEAGWAKYEALKAQQLGVFTSSAAALSNMPDGLLNEELIKEARLAGVPRRRVFRWRATLFFASALAPLSRRFSDKLHASANRRDPRIGKSLNEQPATQKETGLLAAAELRKQLQIRTEATQCRTTLGSVPTTRPERSSDGAMGCSILTLMPPTFGDRHFVECAKSVAQACQQATWPFEWVISVNDMPNAAKQIETLVPESLRPHIRIVATPTKTLPVLGATEIAQYPWFVPLDYDDSLEPAALDLLEKAILEAPNKRYFSAPMQEKDGAPAFALGGNAAPMVAIRSDLFHSLSDLDPRFLGIPNRELTVKIAAKTEIGQLSRPIIRFRRNKSAVEEQKNKRRDRLNEAIYTKLLMSALEGPRLGPLVNSALPKVPTALCVVRTQGKRMHLLRQTLASIRAQALPMTPCVVVHGDDALFEYVSGELAAETSDQHPIPAVLLQAADTKKRRGFPCNVALDYLAANADQYDLLCFLDDDDHFLPGFATRLAKLMSATDADLAYGATNALPEIGEPVSQHKQLPFVGLLAGNFIPFNSFIVRSEAALKSAARFREDTHYLEDYDFLIQLLIAGIRAEALPETASEYRLIGDGNAAEKADEAHFERCIAYIRERLEAAARSGAFMLTDGSFQAEVAAFPGALTGRWSAGHETHMAQAHQILVELRELS